MTASFKGTVNECLEHWMQVVSSADPGRKIVLQRNLSLFLEMHEDTVTGWFKARSVPGASAFIKLAFFFRDIWGYAVEELSTLENQRSAYYHLGEMLGYSVVSAEEIRHKLGYANTHLVHRLLDGLSQAGQTREKLIQGLWKENRRRVEEKRERWREKLSEQNGVRTRSEGLTEVVATLERLTLADKTAVCEMLGTNALGEFSITSTRALAQRARQSGPG